jgi:hypothetical protein
MINEKYSVIFVAGMGGYFNVFNKENNDCLGRIISLISGRYAFDSFRKVSRDEIFQIAKKLNELNESLGGMEP